MGHRHGLSDRRGSAAASASARRRRPEAQVVPPRDRTLRQRARQPGGNGPGRGGPRRPPEGIDALWARAEQQVPGWRSISLRSADSGGGPIGLHDRRRHRRPAAETRDAHVESSDGRKSCDGNRSRACLRAGKSDRGCALRTRERFMGSSDRRSPASYRWAVPSWCTRGCCSPFGGFSRGGCVCGMLAARLWRRVRPASQDRSTRA